MNCSLPLGLVLEEDPVSSVETTFIYILLAEMKG